MVTQEDLEFLESLVEQQSSRLGCSLDCHLVSIDKNFSSMEKRKKLRVKLIEEIDKRWPDKLSERQRNSLLVPGKPPRLPFVSLSITHSSDIGGFIFSTPAYFIGFDLEKQERAKRETVLRISSQEELNLSPSPSALWSAKESAYKAVHLLNGDTPIKKISIFDWQPVSLKNNDSSVYDYQFQVESVDNIGKGYVCFVKGIVIGVAFLNSV